VITAASFWVPVALLGVSFLTAVLIFPLREEQTRLRSAFNLTGALAKLLLVMLMAHAMFRGQAFETRVPFIYGTDFLLRVDYLSLLFAILSAVLWFLTTVYAIGYLEGSPHRSRFFGFFSLCVTATMGIAMAGNLFTFFIFYEFLTVTTWPLVVHRGTGPALGAGRIYLLYTLTGGTILFLGIVLLQSVAGSIEFATGGDPLVRAVDDPAILRIAFLLLVGGLAVKAAIVPLHGWLPAAMVAPAPVSALLHAVAVVKAGVFGIVRVVYDVFGVELSRGLGLLAPLAVISAITILYGAFRALQQEDLKRRLAFSTISQISYIALGIATVSAFATVGGLAHIVHQGLMKVTLFFCAGLFAETLDVHKVTEMNGLGRRMPLTTGAFTIAALGMIGFPPIAGFVSKWYLGLGGIEAGDVWVVVVIGVGSLLNAAYLLPLVGRAWFRAPNEEWATPPVPRHEANRLLLLPTLATGTLSLLVGVMAGAPLTPLWLAELVADQLYGP